MKITIYTVSDCKFSKQEIEFFKSNKLQYQEKNLENNKEFLNEMLAISNNFAGTPVTKIEKDDGQIIVLKGFTEEEFSKEVGITKPPSAETGKIEVPAPVQPAISEKNPLKSVATNEEQAKLDALLSDIKSKSESVGVPSENVKTPASMTQPPQPTAPAVPTLDLGSQYNSPQAVSPPSATTPPVNPVQPPQPPQQTTDTPPMTPVADMPDIPNPDFNK